MKGEVNLKQLKISDEAKKETSKDINYYYIGINGTKKRRPRAIYESKVYEF